jgi:hypothetical protein
MEGYQQALGEQMNAWMSVDALLLLLLPWLGICIIQVLSWLSKAKPHISHWGWNPSETKTTKGDWTSYFVSFGGQGKVFILLRSASRQWIRMASWGHMNIAFRKPTWPPSPCHQGKANNLTSDPFHVPPFWDSFYPSSLSWGSWVRVLRFSLGAGPTGQIWAWESYRPGVKTSSETSNLQDIV